jgi:predicted cupin superfamily sugar epimerase
MTTAQQIIEFFGMRPLPNEGGFYIETYRCREKLVLSEACPERSRKVEGIAQAGLPARYTGDRNLCTAIFYLLTPDTFSALHRVKSDEIFHFYLGDAVTMLQLHPDGSSEVTILGQDIFNGHHVQVIVPQGTWQGCFLNPRCCLATARRGGRFALMGTTVSPGFEFADFEPANREKLLEQYPTQRDLIIRLTR